MKDLLKSPADIKQFQNRDKWRIPEPLNLPNIKREREKNMAYFWPIDMP